MALFKYLPPERLDVIDALRFRFTPANEFEDPFEILPNAKFMDQAQYFSDFVLRTSEKVAKRDVEEGKILASERAERASKLAAELRDEYRTDLDGLKAAALDGLRRSFGAYRILCFSRTAPDDPAALLLWAHYTSGHAGFVLEVEETHDWITGHDMAFRNLRDRGDVEYGPERPDANSPKMSIRRNCYLAKSGHWKYENEHRLIRGYSDAELDSRSLARFPGSLLSSITLGAKCSEVVRLQIFGICQRPFFAHVRIFQAGLHVEKYKATRTELQREF